VSVRFRARVYVLAAVLVLAVCLSATEAALRVRDAVIVGRMQASLPPIAERALIPSRDPALKYELRPGYAKDGFTVNAFGMADGPVSHEKPAGWRRIAVVGDSISCGFKVAPPRLQNWVSELKEGLAPSRVEVLNFAVNGYGALQDLQMARTRALEFSPDLVLVQFCLNDPYPSDNAVTLSGPQPTLRLAGTLLRLWSHERHVGYFAVDRFYDAAGRQQLEGAFAGFAQLQRDGHPVAAVLFPYLNPSAYTRWGFSSYHRLFSDLATRHGVPLLDLRDAFERNGLVRVSGPTDAIHPDAAGHALAAGEVLRWLVRSQI
jgi:lysophospholipase L1-like esterase